MRLWKVLLLPFALIYGLLARIRNFFYDKGFYSSVAFQVPVIGVGNLNTGGTGKTPHVEYLVRLLKDDFKVATLSRGYGRTTKGFKVVKPGMTATEVGDEPAQMKKKFPEATIAVGEDRVQSTLDLLARYPDIQVIVLDDCFQHRKIRPGLMILLTEYKNLYTRDFALPVGRLREPKSGRRRADIIIVTKTPVGISEREEQRIVNEIDPLSHQLLFFSSMTYGDVYPLNAANPLVSREELKQYRVVLVSGIANSRWLGDHLRSHVKRVIHLKFPDHYVFLKSDVEEIKRKFHKMSSDKRIIITTEKDAERLKHPDLLPLIEELPVYVLPIEVFFKEFDKKSFEDRVLKYAARVKAKRPFHRE